MTRFRPRPPAEYLLLIVVPETGFGPDNWQQSPRQYRVIRSAGTAALRGQADAWKFLFNQARLRSGSPDTWAVVVPIDQAREVVRKQTAAITERGTLPTTGERSAGQLPARIVRRCEAAAPSAC